MLSLQNGNTMQSLQLDTVIGAGISLVVGIMGWLVKSTVDKSNKALSLAEANEARIHKVEDRMDSIEDLKLSVGKLETEVKNIDITLKRMESFLLRGGNK